MGVYKINHKLIVRDRILTWKKKNRAYLLNFYKTTQLAKTINSSSINNSLQRITITSDQGMQRGLKKIKLFNLKKGLIKSHKKSHTSTNMHMS